MIDYIILSILFYIYYFSFCVFFFFNDTATTKIYTLSLHDALPISSPHRHSRKTCSPTSRARRRSTPRSDEHTSELQSRRDLVCRLLLEKKKKNASFIYIKKKKKKKKKKK